MYRLYIVHTPYDSSSSQTEYYPNLDKQSINKKIDKLNEETSPNVDECNCLNWRLPNKTIEMTVINNETNETIETASSTFLTLNLNN
jgi:hypothetical protein